MTEGRERERDREREREREGGGGAHIENAMETVLRENDKERGRVTILNLNT